MRRMSRHLAAAAVFAACGAAVASGAGAQEAENPFTEGPDRRMGETSFRVHCALCHGYDARGGAETGGPDLATGRFRRASTQAGLFDVIRNGVAGTAMLGIDPAAPDRVVWQIITYLDSLTPNPAAVDLPGDAAAGRALFAGRGGCAACHMVAGAGGRRGPDLSRVGERRDPDELRADLLDPSREVEPRWWTMVVTRGDGSVVQGARMGEDTFTVRLMDADEQLWSFSKSAIRSFERVRTSSMPAAGDVLTGAEVDDLIAYLAALRKES